MAVTEFGVEVAGRMKAFYESLSEKDRRRYAALEASRLGHGGVEYISRILGCDPKTIWRGQQELQNPPDATRGRIRKKGRSSTLS